MSFNDEDFFNEEIECRIIESYGIFSQGIKFWNKEVNLVSWNGRPAKLDIRNWQMDHEKCGKGITLTREEAEELVKLLDSVLKAIPRAEKPRAGRQASNRSGGSKKTGSPKQRPKSTVQVPISLEPFYRELKLIFGAGPDECKSARNTLLKKYHPDMNAGNIASATRKTIKIKEAYEKIIAWWEAAKL